MKAFIVLSAIFCLCAAVPAPFIHHAPAVYAAPAAAIVQTGVVHQSHVISKPAVASHLETIPASIPAVIPQVYHSQAVIPEHRFSRNDWIQPTQLVIPAVRQHIIESQVPYAVESVKAIPTVQYHKAYQPVAVHEKLLAPVAAPVAHVHAAPLAHVHAAPLAHVHAAPLAHAAPYPLAHPAPLAVKGY